MICNKCGSQISDNSRFCNKCGNKVDSFKIQENVTNKSFKNLNKKKLYIGLTIIIILAICSVLFNYKTILSAYYLNQANKVSGFDEKVELLNKSMNYKATDTNNKTLINVILSETKINSSKAENAVLSFKSLLDNDVFKNLYFNVESYKAAELLSDHKYKEAAEAYASCGKYNIDIVNNKDYITALSQYAETELVKKINISDDDISHYYGIGDIDNDGILDVAVFEKNFALSSGDYKTNNIKLYKYLDAHYTLISSVQCDAESCMNIIIAKASKDTNGIFVSGVAGAHSGIQSLYILKEGKLISGLDKNVGSLYPSQLKDIDGDGILELSSLDRDPRDQTSSNAECLKILTWYKWDGNKGVSIVKKQDLFQ